MKRSCVKSVVRHSLLALAAGTSLLAISGSAFAADSRGVERNREQQQEERRQESAPPQQQSQPQPRQQRAPDQPRFAPPAAQQGGGQREQRPYRGGGNNSWRTYDSEGRPAVVGPPRGNYDRPGNARIVPPGQAYVRRPPRTVPSLPSGHRAYEWRGSPYYWGGGHWYRPYGGSYVIVGAPYGLFVPYLPGSYTTVWVGGSRYYYADGSYYTYEPVRRGYVVARSPYGDDRDDDDDYDDDGGRGTDSRDKDLYIYPMRGQSEQQQADDRYTCHRWAVDQTHYDPTDSKYDRDDRSEYDRALTARLTGRGYSVK